MKAITCDPENNRLLQAERGIGFEDMVFHAAGAILDTFERPNQERYPGQRIHVIEIEGYAWLVPFVESDDEVFLKTMIPSRKATRTYLGDPK